MGIAADLGIALVIVKGQRDQQETQTQNTNRSRFQVECCMLHVTGHGACAWRLAVSSVGVACHCALAVVVAVACHCCLSLLPVACRLLLVLAAGCLFSVLPQSQLQLVQLNAHSVTG
jgi:hypothetical protein